MTFVNAIKICFVKYADFSGRATRSEFWFFTLFYLVLSACMDIVDATIVGKTIWSYQGIFGPAQLIFHLIIMIPTLAVAARRLHDVNKSGWWQLIAITLIGIIPLVIWMATEGTKKNNPYGKPIKIKN